MKSIRGKLLMKPILKPLPNDYGDLLLLDLFLEGVENNFLTNDDGHGYWATEDGMDDSLMVYPSKISDNSIVPPDWATYIMWFNN